MKGVQFYFYDSEHQISNRMSSMLRLDASIVENLVEVLQPNPYADFLKQASELDNIDQYCIVIRPDPVLYQRTYNKPLSNEVDGIWIEDESAESAESANADILDIIVYTKSGRSHIMQYYYGCYDPLRYVLMFPSGEPGWHSNISRVGYSMKKNNRSTNVNIINCNSFEDILTREHQDALSNQNQRRKRRTQDIVDNYSKIESMRLQFLITNQKNTRREYYQGVLDSVISGVVTGGKVGKQVYLPATFIGGPRDMRNQYLDSMAFVQEYGRPDILLTMTCNPNWPEIKERLQPGEEAHNRPDLLARVFKANLNIMNDKIMRDAYDRIVSYELPDMRTNSYLYSLVVMHMMHGQCGDLNPENVRIREGKCKNYYPRWFAEHTSHGKGSYPIYQSRDNQRTTKSGVRLLKVDG
ncbi:hypothetical protein LIER_08482 [Lithospermum erythrorhizon]|uniref:Helitron helicase-like domain-containing protein n=1 Tax=Lithospermum erythrorhizon TaxID=34254 RepID=A0AAV3PEX6_LITER